MAKNRVAPEHKPNKNRGNFFNKPKNKFKSDTKFKQQRFKSNKFIENSDKSVNLKPSVSGSNDFFVKPNNVNVNNLQAEIPKSKGPTRRDSASSKDEKQTEEKKPFDKKAWRLKKYSKKYKLQQWEDKRKQSVLRGYYKTLKEDGPKLDVRKIYDEYKEDLDEGVQDIEDVANSDDKILKRRSNEELITTENEDKIEKLPTNSKTRKNKAFKKAHLEFERIKQEKQKEKELALKQKSEREEALKEYKKKKTEKYKRLSKRTKKGQPIMKDRIEMMLESIQKSLKTD